LLLVVAVVGFVALLPAAAQATPDWKFRGAESTLSAPDSAERGAENSAERRARLEQRRRDSAPGFFGELLRYAYPLLMLLSYFYFTSRDSRASGFGGGWGSYYLFWIIGPALLAMVLEHPAFLLIVALGGLGPAMASRSVALAALLGQNAPPAERHPREPRQHHGTP
jgi:hypothetical protein